MIINKFLNDYTIHIVKPNKTKEEIEQEKAKEKQTNNRTVMVVAATVFLATCAILGYTAAKLESLTKTYVEFDEIEKALIGNVNDACLNEQRFFNVVKDFKKITFIKNEFCKNLKKSTFGSLVSSVSLFAGAYFAVPVLSSIGTFGLIGSLGLGCYHSFNYYFKTEEIQKLSKSIIESVKDYFLFSPDNCNL